MNNPLQLRMAIQVICLGAAALLMACDSLVWSERQKLVKDSHDAMCKARDFKAMQPFVTQSSKPLLELSASLTNLSQIFIGGAISDRIAVECKSVDFRVVDEIQVSDHRYIVRTKNSSTSETIETVVLLEDGQWKIALFGR